MGKIHRGGFDYVDIATRNLYKFLLQREGDAGGIINYNELGFDKTLEQFLNCEEYLNLKKNKNFDLKLDTKLDYTILKINDRANKTLEPLHNLLQNDFTHHNIEFVNYKNTNIDEFFASRNIKNNWIADLWGLSTTTSPSELAVTASHLVAMEYLLEKDLDQIIVFEDDVILDSNFLGILANCLKDLPKDYDFMADSTLLPNYEEFSTEDWPIDAGSKYICKSNLQNAHTGFMLYSKSGAKRILEMYRQYGLMCSIDTFLFWLSRRGSLNGYTTFYSNKLLYQKDIYGSMVTNKRA